jgi:hypothetical protein
VAPPPYCIRRRRDPLTPFLGMTTAASPVACHVICVLVTVSLSLPGEKKVTLTIVVEVMVLVVEGGVCEYVVTGGGERNRMSMKQSCHETVMMAEITCV